MDQKGAARAPADGRAHAMESARARARELSDDALLDAMATGDHLAWYEFDARFRPRLERFAECIGVPTASWPECIQDVLEDAAMRLAFEHGERPASLIGYLVRAVRNRAVNVARRDRRQSRVSEDAIPVGAVYDPRREPGGGDDAGPLARIAALLRTSLTTDEEILLGWVVQGVPYRQIAAWLGIGYDATAKRIARLNARLRSRLAEHSADCDPRDRATIDRLLGTAKQPGPHQ